MKLRFVLIFLGILLTCEIASAIQMGVPAPALNVTTWVKGEPVDLRAAARSNKVVLVEFWATYCPPCRDTIPHLTELKKKHPDLAVVGITTEDPLAVKRFVTQMGDKMVYSVGIDETGQTIEAYMSEYATKPIPWAFIVNREGILVWSGPGALVNELDAALADVFSGKLTVELARRRALAKNKLNEFIQLVSTAGDEARAGQLGKEIEALDAELGGIQPGKKFSAVAIQNQFKFDRLKNDYFMAVMAGNSSTNLNRLEQKLTEVAPPGFDLADFKELAVLEKDFNEYMRAASGRGDTNRIPELTRRLAGTKIKTVDPLLQVAWNIVLGESLKPRDLDLAASLAKRAVELSDEKNIDALFVYGRTLSEGGKVADAIKWHKKAIAGVGDNAGARAKLEADLAAYEEKLKQN